jgi:hypothetical protein
MSQVTGKPWDEGVLANLTGLLLHTENCCSPEKLFDMSAIYRYYPLK